MPITEERVSLQEFSFIITKASVDKASGEMRWMAVASDTDEDSYKQRMSLELFSDFVTKAQQDAEAPVEFRSEYWKGGMPYLSVSHYDDFNGQGSAGETTSIYIDGNRLKAKGICYDTPLGKAAFKAIKASIDNPSEDNKVRISIGFLDWKHTHDGMVFDRKSLYDMCPMCRKSRENVVFLRGQLIHLALTRVPVNQRTIIEAEVTKSMTTMKEDAASIVGEEEAEKLDSLAQSMVGKSEALVVKSDEVEVMTEPEADNEEVITTGVVNGTEEVEVEDAQVAVTEKSEGEIAYSLPYGGATSFADMEAWMAAQEKIYKAYDTWYTFEALASNIMASDSIEDKSGAMAKLMGECKDKLEMKSFAIMEKIEKAMLEGEPMVQKAEVPSHPLDEAFMAMKSVFDDTVSLSEQERLVALQVPLESLANTLKEAVKVENTVAPEEPVPSAPQGFDVAELKSIVADAIAPLAENVNILMQAQSGSAVRGLPRQETAIPPRRGLPAQTTLLAKPSTSPTPKLHDIVMRSVGLGGSDKL